MKDKRAKSKSEGRKLKTERVQSTDNRVQSKEDLMLPTPSLSRSLRSLRVTGIRSSSRHSEQNAVLRENL